MVAPEKNPTLFSIPEKFSMLMSANSKNRFTGQKVLDKEELYNVVVFKKKGFKNITSLNNSF